MLGPFFCDSIRRPRSAHARFVLHPVSGEVRDTPWRSPALELPKKLPKDDVKARFRRNLVASPHSEMLLSAVIRSQDRVTMSLPIRWLLRSAGE